MFTQRIITLFYNHCQAFANLLGVPDCVHQQCSQVTIGLSPGQNHRHRAFPPQIHCRCGLEPGRNSQGAVVRRWTALASCSPPCCRRRQAVGRNPAMVGEHHHLHGLQKSQATPRTITTLIAARPPEPERISKHSNSTGKRLSNTLWSVRRKLVMWSCTKEWQAGPAPPLHNSGA